MLSEMVDIQKQTLLYLEKSVKCEIAEVLVNAEGLKSEVLQI
jgi:hypothetical protein